MAPSPDLQGSIVAVLGHIAAKDDALNATLRATHQIAAATPATSRAPATGRVRSYKSAKVYILTTVKVN